MKERRKRRKPVHRKVTGAAVGAAAVTVGVYVLRWLGVDVNAELADALGILGAFAGGWLRTEK